MILGIVGADAEKFSSIQVTWARRRILELFKKDAPTLVVSGRCPAGGIDIWAVEEAYLVGIKTREFPPAELGWRWYKERNIKIAESSDKVACIVASRSSVARKCAHCAKSGIQYEPHVQSGGCWTMHYARSIGKQWQLIVIGGMSQWTRRP